MKKLVLTLFATIGLITLSFSQYVDQALIFSQHNFGSTARSQAMGGAFGAIGGDFSSLSINPAGIGVYLKPEISATFDIIGVNSVKSTYQGQSTDDRNNNFSMRNLGYVFTTPAQGGNSGLVSFNFGIGFNKLNNYNQTSSVSSINSPTSRMNAFAQNTNGVTTTDLVGENNPWQNQNVMWESEMAWQNYLINVSNPDQNGVGNAYQSILFQNELVNQNLTVNKQGYLNEYVFSFGANFNHKLYLGATLGIQDLYYSQSSIYSENGGFGRFDYYNYASTRGTGYNLKLGVIYKPTSALRLGLAIHTPTLFDLKENYNSSMTSELQNVSTDANGTHSSDSPFETYGYKMDTPTRIIASIAYQFGKKGMLSCDYEYVDYSKMQYHDGNDGYNFSVKNSIISSVYRSVGNLRFGGEFKPISAVSLRAGYELFGNPYSSSVVTPDPNNAGQYLTIAQPNTNFSYRTVNFGVGYRINNVSFDLTYSQGSRTDYGYTYQGSDSNTATYFTGSKSDLVKYQNTNSQLIFTLAFKL